MPQQAAGRQTRRDALEGVTRNQERKNVEACARSFHHWLLIYCRPPAACACKSTKKERKIRPIDSKATCEPLPLRFRVCDGPAVIHRLFSAAERQWMAAGSSPRASGKVITSIAPACAEPGREGRGALIFWARGGGGLNQFWPSIMSSHTL